MLYGIQCSFTEITIFIIISILIHKKLYLLNNNYEENFKN